MRFRAGVQNIHTFTKLTASLAALGQIVWIRLDDKHVHFTVIPEKGSQVWSVFAIDQLFEEYTLQSAASDNTINLEVPLAPLQRALKSAQNAIAASIRLTKRDNIPLLSLTITTSTVNSSIPSNGHNGFDENPPDEFDALDNFPTGSADPFATRGQDRETTVTQDIPIRVLAPASVEGLHQPVCRDFDVYITLPNLMQLKSISDRFAKLALSTKSTSRTGFSGSSNGPKLELSGNMHGCLRLALKTESLRISSLWTGLENPELDVDQMPEGEDGLVSHPSTRMRELGDTTGQSEEGWATVRIEGKDWGRVLSVGRLGGRVIACFCHDHAVILYVFLGGEETGVGESVLTVSRLLCYLR